MNSSPAITARPSRPAPVAGLIELAREWGVFVREALTNPREVGAVIPSSRVLARRMAELADVSGTGPIVELGAGTGVVTEALLDRCIAPRRIVAVERSETMADLLRRRFPRIRVICGDAAELRRWLSAKRTAPPQVVSSLPLRSLPPDKVQSILREIAELLRHGGQWIQYTYALRRNELPPGFTRHSTSLVWQNVPPARVDVYSPAPGN